MPINPPDKRDNSTWEEEMVKTAPLKVELMTAAE